jgi:hypothetical protein
MVYRKQKLDVQIIHGKKDGENRTWVTRPTLHLIFIWTYDLKIMATL